MNNGFRLTPFIRKLEQSTTVRSVRSGLVNIIPVLIIGAFALIFKTFPVAAYQKFIASFGDGFFVSLFDIVFGATFGALSVYMTFSISRSYMKIMADPDAVPGAAGVTSVICFLVLAGIYLPDFSTDNIGPKSMFLSIITGLGVSALYLKLDRYFRKRRRTVFSSGANREFNLMLSTLFPTTLIVAAVSLFDLAVVRIFGVDSFRMLLSRFFDWIFSFGEVGFVKGFFFVLLSSLLWMFGIHGSDTLESVMQTYFAPGITQNMAAVAAGAAPTAVLTKQFFDCFVLMGGCGSTICLLIALLIFSRNRARRGLAFTAAFPMIFNINELMVFGLPIIFNPVMLIPFLAVPLVCYSSAYLALSSGLVPLITSEIEWTTPIILGGYQATGSVGGALLQVFNVILGVLIYMPFVRLLDKTTEEESRLIFASFTEFFKKNQSLLASKKLTDLSDINGDLAKSLSADIRYGAERQKVSLAYQPQYLYDGKCVGVEALLRLNHPSHGVIYPPLVIKLAQDGGFLETLEEAIVTQVLEDMPRVHEVFGKDVKISFNVTGETVVSDKFLQFLRQLNVKDPFKGKNLCVEITEQTALTFDDRTLSALREIHNMGFLLAIDDFSMGQTSLNYLKDNMFDIIKLDGSLVRGLSTHANCREIISSIVKLSSTLNLTVLAEYVETASERDTLYEIGCKCYQGYYYSPAVYLDKKNAVKTTQD